MLDAEGLGNTTRKLTLDPDVSIGAMKHKYRHMLDDLETRHPGMRIIADIWKK